MTATQDVLLIDRKKRRGYFIIENHYLDEYGPRIGVIGWGVYTVLCRFADSNGTSFPSQETIAAKIGVSRAAANRAIATLVKVGLLEKEQRYNKHGGKTSLLYALVDPQDAHDVRHSDNPMCSTVTRVVTNSDNPMCSTVTSSEQSTSEQSPMKEEYGEEFSPPESEIPEDQIQDPTPQEDSARPPLPTASGPRATFLTSNDWAEQFFETYPKRTAFNEIEPAMEVAIVALRSKHGWPDQRCVDHLLAKASEFAASKFAATCPRKELPSPGLWLKNGRYRDDPAEWDIDASGAKPRGPVKVKVPKFDDGRKSSDAKLGSELERMMMQ